MSAIGVISGLIMPTLSLVARDPKATSAAPCDILDEGKSQGRSDHAVCKAPLAPFALGSMKILLVDDHASIRDALLGVLRELVGASTALLAPDFRQAMRLIEQHPDLNLILLDVAPNRDGFRR